MAITAAMVKELREISGAGMMDCKKALTATDGDMDKAMEFLREKGLATAQKKAGRIAAEGIVMLKVSDDAKKAVAVKNSRIMWRRLQNRLWKLPQQISKHSWQSPGSLIPARPYPKRWLIRLQPSERT